MVSTGEETTEASLLSIRGRDSCLSQRRKSHRHGIHRNVCASGDEGLMLHNGISNLSTGLRQSHRQAVISSQLFVKAGQADGEDGDCAQE